MLVDLFDGLSVNNRCPWIKHCQNTIRNPPSRVCAFAGFVQLISDRYLSLPKEP